MYLCIYVSMDILMYICIYVPMQVPMFIFMYNLQKVETYKIKITNKNNSNELQEQTDGF